jgi:hypothetical protein
MTASAIYAMTINAIVAQRPDAIPIASPRERLERFALILLEVALSVDESAILEVIREMTDGAEAICPAALSRAGVGYLVTRSREIIQRSPCEPPLQIASARCAGCTGAPCFCEPTGRYHKTQWWPCRKA